MVSSRKSIRKLLIAMRACHCQFYGHEWIVEIILIILNCQNLGSHLINYRKNRGRNNKLEEVVLEHYIFPETRHLQRDLQLG
jgi:hypothetical protein